MMQIAETRHRLVWVDLAKAVAIIAMILGHEIGEDNSLHVWIYSFHMPIFFILSGYTSHLITNWNQWLIQLRKLSVRILIPAVLMIILYQVERFFFGLIKWSQVWLVSGKELFWGADPSISMKGLTVEIEWFLFLYFFAKLFFGCFNIIFKDRDFGIILVVLSFACYQFISIHLSLPLVLDLVPLASFYMYIGHLIKSKQEWLSTYYYLIVGLAFIYWGMMIVSRQSVDMATRQFTGNYILGILETIAGSFIVITACQVVDHFKIMAKLSLLGKHTLLLMFIHELDCYNFTSKYIVSACHLNNYTSGIYRVLVDVLALFIILWGIKIFHLLFNNTTEHKKAV